jgi:hypothetical protein
MRPQRLVALVAAVGIFSLALLAIDCALSHCLQASCVRIGLGVCCFAFQL